MTLIETPRTVLRDMTADDAPFILDLLNQPTFLRYIGDRQVRTMHDSVQFIETRYRQSYRDHGYGLYIVQLRDTSQPIGMCGFVKRAGLPCADMGFAFLPAFEGHGYASESAIAALQFGRDTLGLGDLLAIAQPDNVRSHRLLQRLGFASTGELTLPGETAPVTVFALSLVPTPPSVGPSDDATGCAE